MDQMNALIFTTLAAFILMWLIYLAALRRSRFAFFFWFPLTASAGIGTLAWIWAGLMLLSPARNIGGGDPESGGFALLGAGLAFGFLLICPITFAISLWLRPSIDAFRPVSVVPTLIVYALILACFGKIGFWIENQTIKLTVLNAQSVPIQNVKVTYVTMDHHFGFAFPSSPLKGEVLTDAEGTAVLPVPKTHQIFCQLTKVGFAPSSFQMDRAWSSGLHQSNFSWNAPSHFVAGSVQFDIPDSKTMNTTLYMAHDDATEKLPYPASASMWMKENK